MSHLATARLVIVGTAAGTVASYAWYFLPPIASNTPRSVFEDYKHAKASDDDGLLYDIASSEMRQEFDCQAHRFKRRVRKMPRQERSKLGIPDEFENLGTRDLLVMENQIHLSEEGKKEYARATYQGSMVRGNRSAVELKFPDPDHPRKVTGELLYLTFQCGAWRLESVGGGSLDNEIDLHQAAKLTLVVHDLWLINKAEQMFYEELGMVYWCADVRALHYGRLRSDGSQGMFISSSLAAADVSPFIGGVDLNGGGKPDFEVEAADLSWRAIPKNGYYFRAISLDWEGKPYKVTGSPAACHGTRFGFCAFPAEYGVTGKYTFVIDESGVVFQMDNGGVPEDRFPTNWNSIS